MRGIILAGAVFVSLLLAACGGGLGPTQEAQSLPAQETKQVTWTVPEGGVTVLVDVPGDWEEDAAEAAAYAAGGEDVLFLHNPGDAGLPAMAVLRIPRMSDAQIRAQISELLKPSEGWKGSREVDGDVGGVATSFVVSVSIAEGYEDERVTSAYAQLEDGHTWMLICRALESDAGQHADCDAALRSVRVAPEPAAAEGALAAAYTEAGERLGRERSPALTWADGSNWNDGVSDQVPDLPLSLDTRIQDGMTCAQWEALEVAAFPEGEGYDRSSWWQHPDSDEIATEWEQNLAVAVWGQGNEAMARKFIGSPFADHCGERMR